MENGTIPQTGEEQRREIEGLYKNKRRKIEQYAMTGIFAGIALAIAGLSYSLLGNPQGKSEVFQRYDAAVTSLNELERERSNPELNLPYIPEDAKPHIENFYKERRERVKSLDEAIGVYKKDISEIEQSEEFRAKTEIERKASSKMVAGGGMIFGAAVLVLLSGMGATGYIMQSEKRQAEELKKLEESLA